MFRKGLLSIIRSIVLYTQQYVFVILVMLTAYGVRDLASSQHNQYDKYVLLCVQYYTPDDGQ